MQWFEYSFSVFRNFFYLHILDNGNGTFFWIEKSLNKPGLFPGSENKKLKPPIDLLPFKEEYTSVTVGWKTHYK